MEITINFDTHNEKAISLVKFLKSLDFISITSKDYQFSEFEKEYLKRGINDIEEGNVSTHENVVMEAKQKYPNLFK